jgi:hypothetical protein
MGSFARSRFNTLLTFGREAEVLRAAQEASRSLSIGRFLTVGAAKVHVQSEISHIPPNATITTMNGLITTTSQTPTADPAAAGIAGAFASACVYLRAAQMSEAWQSRDHGFTGSCVTRPPAPLRSALFL